MDWFVCDFGGDKFPPWMRTLGVSRDDGEVFVAAAIGGNEQMVLGQATDDRARAHHRHDHAYVSATWLSSAFPGVSVVCEKLTIIARNNTPPQKASSEAVAQYTELALQPGGDDGPTVTMELHRRGFTRHQSRDALRFTPIAFGRRWLQDRGAKFPERSERFLVLSPDGEVLQQGALADHAVYSAAFELGPTLLPSAAMERIAFRSPEVLAFADAVCKGSNPEDLEWTPVIFFSSNPSPTGLQRAEQLTRSFLGLDSR